MIDWLPWSAPAFARASREGKPVLLSITAAWCRACHDMDRTTYADPAVAAAIGDRFVAVRVDTDRRPDINERYNLGGWPTTAFLTADGRLIAGGTFIAADRMASVLGRVAEAFDARGAEWRSAEGAEQGTEEEAAEYTADTEYDRAADALDSVNPVAGLLAAIYATFDEEFGGFGVEPKFPHTAPVHLALALFRETGAPRWRAIAERTLDAMWDGGLRDRAPGGFFRYAATRDWQQPHMEKLLETNAALLAAYAEASVVLGRSADRDRVADVARFITGSLRDSAGGYYGSDADRVLYADANAAAAAALLRAAAVLDDAALGREALGSFERVLLGCYRPGAGLAHYVSGDETVRGLIGDQVAAIAALLEAHDLTGVEPYQMMAEEIGHYLVREMWDATAGGFFDRSTREDDIGLLRTPRKPFVLNAEAAVALSRLHRVSREFDFSPYAQGALASAARQARTQGPLAAHYVLAARQVG
jgi:uncharacterized protein YyaL (SSP411 family)